MWAFLTPRIQNCAEKFGEITHRPVARAYSPDPHVSTRRLSARYGRRGTDRGDAQPAPGRPGSPRMVHARNYNTVSGLERVHAIIESKFDAALEDQVEVDGVGVVHRGDHIGLVLDYLPLQAPTAQTQVIRAGVTRRSGRRRSGPCGVDSCRQVAHGRGFQR